MTSERMNNRSESSSKRNARYCCDGSDEDDIVITGMAGRFPSADNVEELAEGLFNKKNFISEAEDRWPARTFPNFLGALNDLSTFDASFFDVYPSASNAMPPDHRLLLEVTYEAIVDSGYDPKELKGKNIGIYHANAHDDISALQNSSLKFAKVKREDERYFGLSFVRCSGTNRISYVYDFHGPSRIFDSACSSSGSAMWQAFNDLKNGLCDGALVAGSQIIVSPEGNCNYLRSKVMSTSGKCSSFDENADGFIRSEAVACLFLQKAKKARRMYANIVNIKEIQAGHHSEAIFVPSEEAEKKLFRAIYKESGISPVEVTFIEAHGTGTKVGDPIELKSISEIFCEGRKELLPIGAIKSNIGHTEAVSGICSVIKCVITMETGVIPPNVNFKTLLEKCQPSINGKLQVVTEPTSWKRGYIGVNNFGLGGELVHIILKRNSLDYDSKETDEHHLPQLFLFPGRTEEGVKVLFDYMEKNLVHREFAALIHKSAYAPVSSKSYRGFAVMKKTKNLVSGIKQCRRKKSEVWYVFTGMGCQWPGMALDLMELDAFAKSMRRSAQVLQPFGIDLFDILKREGNSLTQEKRITPAFVAIAAIQIALVDILNELGIQPDGIVGHSTGELVCAYADGCCTAEETILSAYWRGQAVESTDLPTGSMAAVGITWEEAMKRCPEGVYPACHNAKDSVTISGLKKPVGKFVEVLQAEKVFAREVNTYGYGFHCNCINPAMPILKNALTKLILDPKPRSPRWISSSYLEEQWDTPEAKMADADYFVHNLVSPVHFHEALLSIPKDVITIEIGPHHLLQSILKRVIGNDAEYIGMMKRETDNVKHLLASIGRMYAAGLNPDVEALYPPVNFPVPRSTPSISSLIRWDHSQAWNVPKFNNEEKSTVMIDVDILHRESYDWYLLDHCIDGRALFPATGYLMLAMKALTEIKQKEITETPVVIENFKILRATILSHTERVRFEVIIFYVGGEFQINEGKATVATGRIYIPDKPLFNNPPPDYVKHESTETLSGADIYNEIRIEGYEYGPHFQGVIETDFEGNQGLVKWNGKWIPFLDSLILLMGLIGERNGLILPVGIERVKIDPIVHLKYLKDRSENHLMGVPVLINKSTKKCISGGVEIKNLRTEIAPRRQTHQNAPTLEEYRFIPYNEECALTEKRKEMCQEYLKVCCEVAKNISLATRGKKSKEISKDFKGSKNIFIDDYLNCLTEEHVLLSTLKDISEYETCEELLKNLPERFNNYVQNVANDILSNTLMTEVPLRAMLDIVAENSSQNLKVLEMCDRRIPLSVTVQDMFMKYCHLQVNCTVTHCDPNSFDLKALEKSDIKVAHSTATRTDFPNKRSIDIVLGAFCFGSKNDLKSYIKTLSSVVKDERFILLFHRFTLTTPEAFLSELCGEVLEVQQTIELEKIFVEESLVIISKKSDTLSTSVYLLKKTIPCKAGNNYRIVPVVEGRYEEWVEKLKQTLHEAKGSDISSVWLVAQDNPLNGIVGLVNCLRKEPGGEKIRCLFMDPTDHIPPFDPADSYYFEILRKDILMNVHKNGTWGSFRHSSMDYDNTKIITKHSYINCMKLGDLSSFQWIESPLKNWKQHSKQKTLCHVYFSAINFRDVMLAIGKIAVSTQKDSSGNSDCPLGLEFSGRDMNGRRVMGMVNEKGMATTVEADPGFVWEVPDEWTLEDASTVPVVYATCYYALFMRGNMQKGESILIHSGSGGVGQAAIAIAISMDCEIFTTVGTKEKRKFLKEKFPQLKDQNIGCSRDTSFEDLVLQQTQGNGVNIVLNSLADDKLQASVRCLSKNGRFLEIGKYDMFMDHSLGLHVFLKNIAFHGIFLDPSFETNHIKNKISEYVAEGIRNGVVKPLNKTIFNKDKIEEAFRYMASGKHIGKVIIKMRDEEPEKVIIPKSLSVPAVPRTYFSSEKCYIVIGGLGGFGIELIKWMFYRGARNIVISSRSGPTSSYHKFCLQRWQRQGNVVVLSTLNVANREEANKLLKESALLAPIGGIFNLALVLKDAIMENQTAKNFEKVCAPKAEATKNLDELSRSLCPELDWFVCFSSISCGKGNPGQTNYGYANSVMERICEKRRNDGLHGLAIQWGIVGDVGIVHRTMGVNFSIGGFTAQRIKSCLSTLDTFLQGYHSVVCSYVTADASIKKGDREGILNKLANALGFDALKDIDADRTLGEMGMDSLVAVEVKTFLDTHFDTTVTTEEILNLKIGDIEKRLDDSSKKYSLAETEANTLEKLTFIFPDELVPKAALISLNAQSSGIPLFIVSLTEVVAPGFKVLAQELNYPVYGVQCTRDIPTTSLKDMALWHLKMIQNIYPNGPINVAGYSYGAIVAFEMALQSQDSDSFPALQKLILINCSPLINMLNGSDRNADEVILTKAKDITHLLSFAEQYAESDISPLRDHLISSSSFETKFITLSNFMMEFNSGALKIEDLTAAMENYCRRLETAEMYKPNQKLRTNLLLVELFKTPDLKFPSKAKNTFSEVSEALIFIEEVEGTIQSLARKENATQTAALINKYLSQ